MSNIDGLLINNNNIYGLVNPPPAPTSGDKAKGHQDISSAAVRWDSFVDLSSTVVDLSNTQLTVIQASPYFNSIIDRVPYNTVHGVTNFLLYPLYQQGQIVFTQDKTFTKMRLYLKGRNGKIAGFKHLGDLLPGDTPPITGVRNYGFCPQATVCSVNIRNWSAITLRLAQEKKTVYSQRISRGIMLKLQGNIDSTGGKSYKTLAQVRSQIRNHCLS